MGNARLRRMLPVLVALVLSLGVGCGRGAETTDAEEGMRTEAQRGVGADAEGWITLFDGTGTDHWRGYRRDDLPPAWQIGEDGTLHFTAEGEGGDIVTRAQYENFELELEWKISEKGNSGIMFRVTEDHDTPWRTGPEVQMLDDAAYAAAEEGLKPVHASGANYDMHAPSKNVVRPTGQWNALRLVVNGAHVEHWLNGEKVVDYALGSEAWKARVAESKWVEMPDYGRKEVGHLSLQDHGNPVWFRNIRIRPLSALSASSI